MVLSLLFPAYFPVTTNAMACTISAPYSTRSFQVGGRPSFWLKSTLISIVKAGIFRSRNSPWQTFALPFWVRLASILTGPPGVKLL